MRFTESSIDELLIAWPRLRRAPMRADGISSLLGVLDFELSPSGRPAICDAYRVRIDVPINVRDAIPAAFEIGGRIPHDIDEHMVGEGQMCLGSPLAVRLQLGPRPTLSRFVDQCVVPFLYAASWRRQGHEGWPFDELLHGAAGVAQDYRRLLGLEDSVAIGRALTALSRRPRVANKLPCACGCRRRLGRCAYRFALRNLRASLSRAEFRGVTKDFFWRIGGTSKRN